MDRRPFLTRHLPILLGVVLVGFYLGHRASPAPMSFIRINPDHPSPVPAELLQVLQNANEDMNELLLGKAPKHARQGMRVLDGGSRVYEHSGYRLWDYRKLNSVNGTLMVMRGVSVQFKDGDSWPGGPWGDASYTWLEPAHLAQTTSP